MSTAASPSHFGRTILRTCGAAATRPGSGFFFPRTRGGRCVSASKHRLPEGTGWDAVVAFHGGFLAHSAQPGTGLEPWRIGTGGGVAAASRRPVPKATMPRANGKGGAGGYDCIPKVAVQVPLDTVLDVFLVGASPADAKPIASRGLYRPISDRAAPPALASGRRALEMGLEMGWNLPCWGPCSPDGQGRQAAAGVGVCQWRARTGSRVFKLRQDASGECKEEQDNDNPSLPVSSARCCPVTSGRTSRSLHRLHGRRSPHYRRHQVEEEWRRQSNPAWSRFSVSNTCPTGQWPGNMALAWSQLALILAVENNPTRSDAVVLPSAVVACETCTQGPHQPTVNVWLPTENIPDFSSAGPQQNKLGKKVPMPAAKPSAS